MRRFLPCFPKNKSKIVESTHIHDSLDTKAKFLDPDFHYSLPKESRNPKRTTVIELQLNNTMTVNTTDRLTSLRKQMEKFDIQAYIVPSEDSHQSEYIAECDARRSFISGFTGSAGLAVVTLKEAALWTDGRYFLQASQQLDSNWILMKSGLPNVPSKESWLLKTLPSNSRVGIDPTLITADAAKLMKRELSQKNYSLVSINENLIDVVWASHRPARPNHIVSILSQEYAGQEFILKVDNLRKKIENHGKCKGFVVSALDEIAWLFNLRGSDIPYNPVFFAYALITLDEAFLFIDDVKLTKETRAYLDGNVIIRPYSDIFSHLQNAVRPLIEKQELKFWVDARCNLALYEALGGESNVHMSRSPVMDAKALKNATELEGFRQCHIRDAAALVSYFAWLENEIVVNKNSGISEYAGAEKLEEFRSQQKDFVGLSFDTISSTGPNAAIIHYKPEKETCSLIRDDQIYLCDSGGQYKDGTTDVTRTLHFGTPTDFEREAFTRVLKGHVQLDMTVFPTGTTGYILDAFARSSLWKAGLDYRHGTGHGVGSFLNVHEGPQGIGIRIGYNDIPLTAGMTVTNEPGYYQDGQFGIRIENVLLIRPASTPNNFGENGYLCFEHVTVVPIQMSLVKTELLTHEEKLWLNSYHEECWQKVSPLLEKESLAYLYLYKQTREI